jgi:hypothetical protein
VTGFTGSGGGFTGSVGFTGSRGFTGSIGTTGFTGSTSTTVTVVDDGAQATAAYIMFASGAGSQTPEINTVRLTYVPLTGTFTINPGSLTVDTLTLDGNTISTSTLDGNITIQPNGNGNVVITESLIPSVNNSFALGSASLRFTNVFALASSAQYADLSEKFLADARYDVGTVLMIGGNAEVTAATKDSRAIVGTVSENPGFIMNDTLEGDNVVAIAYIGRVPCKVEGNVKKGDLLVVSNNAGVATSVTISTEDLTGKVVGKALESNDSTKSIIEILVGRL